jgi:hypothetical protein
MAAMAGFGAALQGYSHDLWGQTGEAYRNAAAAQQSMAQGLGGQVGSGVAEMRAQEAALAGGLGYTGGSALPTPEAATAQVASEGGAKTGETMGQVGTAWGGYGATRPEYIGFMTGQNQQQIAREQIEANRDLQSEFLKLGMENPITALDMWSKIKESKRQDASTALATQTLKSNIALQSGKLRQAWWEGRQKAKTAADKIKWDKWYKGEKLKLDQQGIGIDQQTADARAISAAASMTSAKASASRAATADYKAKHPTLSPSLVPKYSGGSYQSKIASSMGALPSLFERSGGSPKQREDYAFGVLWGQMAPYISGVNKAKAKAVLRQRIKNAAKAYAPKPSSGGGSDIAAAIAAANAGR